MAYQGISTGTGPNQGDGDTLVDGAAKINANFGEIYTALGDGTNIVLTKDRLINTGDGLSGGGNLNSDRTLSVSVGSGITISSGSVSVDDSVIRTSGNQTITGILTATSFVGNGTIPVGGIIMWSGTIAEIPTGWALCDGTNSTPDLRARFIVGAESDGGTGETFNADTGATSGQYAPGNTGGETAHQLTTAEMPSHNHSYSLAQYDRSITDDGPDQTSSVSFTTGNTGSRGSDDYHENRPKYYALAFIMRIL